MTRTLITNDDGIDAPGLHALARAALGAGLDVVVAAPMRAAHGLNAGAGRGFRQMTQLTIKPRMQKAMSMIT